MQWTAAAGGPRECSHLTVHRRFGLSTRHAVAMLVAAMLALAGASGDEAAGSADRPLKVAVVVDPPGRGGDAWGQMARAGLRRAVVRLGIDREAARVLRPPPREGYLPTLLYLGRSRYDLVIGADAFGVDAIDTAARRFPATRFVILDQEYARLPHHPRNVAAVTYASEEAGFLAGYLAGLVERRDSRAPAVGSVGGMKAAQVDRFIAGYQAGARRAARGITVLNGYSGGFLASQRAKCRNVALAQIARGAGVIFPVAGACGSGALQAAKQKGVWGIGVDVDQSALGPHILTSALKHVDAAIFESVLAAQRGRLGLGRTTVLGVRQGAVGLGRISPRVPRALVAKVESVRQLIASGRLRTIPTTVR